MRFPFGWSYDVSVLDKKNGTKVIVLKSDIIKLYSSMHLKKPVIRKIVKAHEKVLKYGLKTGNERVIVIDSETGKIVAEETGTPDSVIWYWNPASDKRLITIHNHPNSTPFSHIDLYGFGSSEQTKCMGIQGHNGRMYSLRKTVSIEFNLTKDSLFLILIGIKTANKEKSDIELGELFVETVANAMQWEFLKGAE